MATSVTTQQTHSYREPEIRLIPRGDIDVLLLATTALLVLLGVVSVYAGSAFKAAEISGDSMRLVRDQIMGVGVGVFVMLFGLRFDYRRYYRLVLPIFLASFVLLALTMVPGLGLKVNGAQRWLDLPLINLQPAEVVKVAVVFFMAYSVTKKRERLQQSLEFFGHSLVLLPFIFVLMLQPDFGSSLIISLITGATLFVAGARFSHIFFVVLALLILGAAAIFTEGYRISRVLVWLDPWADQASSGYQLTQTWAALSRGGLDGVGFGNSAGAMGFVPELHTDFVAAVIGEQFGFVGIAGLVALFALFGWRGYRIAFRAVDRFGFYLAFGLTTLVMLQATINLAVVTGVFPTKGLTLPFVSYGRSSIVVMFFIVGVLLNISQRNPDHVAARDAWLEKRDNAERREASLRDLAEKHRKLVNSSHGGMRS